MIRYVTFRNLGVVGRLGNSIYQAAATIGIARRMGAEPVLSSAWLHRPYFSFPESMYRTPEEIDELLAASAAVEAHDTAAVAHIDPRARVYLQDQALFRDVRDEVRSYLAPSDVAAAELDRCVEFRQLDRPILGIHVRRGDNVKDPGVPDKHRYYPVPQFNYYMTAAAAAAQRIHELGHGSFAVFSDDIAWCRANFPTFYFHEGVPRPKEHEPDYLTAPVLDWIDWQLLASCDFHVLSNSTFGISAALLGTRGDSPYVAPTVPWPIYGPKLSYIDASLLWPQGYWRRLDTRTGAPC